MKEHERKQKCLARQIIAGLWCPAAFNVFLPRVGSCTPPQVLTLFSTDSFRLAVCKRTRMNSNTAIESKHYLHSEVIDLTDLRLPPPSIHSGFNTLISRMLACAHLCELSPSSCRNFPGPDFSEGRVPVSVVLTSLAMDALLLVKITKPDISFLDSCMNSCGSERHLQTPQSSAKSQ